MRINLFTVCMLALAVAMRADEEARPMTIQWLPETLTLVQGGGGYGRIIRLQDSRLLCAYSRGPQIRIRTSRDEGKTWEPEIQVTNYTHGVATNAEASQLKDGTILVGINGRPNDKKSPFTIQCARSTDNGKTWEPARIVYSAGTTFQTGCWEPAFLQLPDGTVQLYFANEGPFTKSHEQEITMVSSADSGVTWGEPKRVTFRAKHRDGMPVPLILADGKTLVLAIEDNGLNGSFKPVLCKTSVDTPWSNAPIAGDSPDRWNPLATPLAAHVYAGAPYICQTSAGHTALTFQFQDKRIDKRGDKAPSYAVVCLGDPQAKQFAPPTEPFASVGNPKSMWNSVFAKDADTITLVSSATINGKGGIWTIDGKILPTND